MSFNRSRRGQLGPRYGEKISRLVNKAITCANRNNYQGFRVAVEEAYQMIDDLERIKFGDKDEKQVRETEVAAKAKPNKATGGAAKKTPRAKKGTGAARKKDSGAGDLPKEGA